MNKIQTNITNFEIFDFKKEILNALKDIGYEEPSPIQEKAIPVILAGVDIIGQAQTGTGKTAAFALPSLNKIDVDKRLPQILVLTPTRELALQVSSSYENYAKYLKKLKVVCLYGGAPIGPQIKDIKNGAHIIVVTPGRLIDHLRRNKSLLNNIDFLVLDEADEMLKMGFMDDLEVIFDNMPKNYQTALFSATLPAAIKKIAEKRLNNPVNIKIASKTQTVERIEQSYILVYEEQKIEAMLRILETENFDALIAFVRTKQETLNIATHLGALGYKVAALNGDIAQNQREAVVESLKDGGLDIVIATDVAARGIDISRISHVVNFDIPYDGESYVHRIGRTGRAGRTGKAFLLITPREKRMLNMIEKITRQEIQEIPLPSAQKILNARISKIMDNIQKFGLLVNESHLNLVNQILDKLEIDSLSLNNILLAQIIGNNSLELSEIEKKYPNRIMVSEKSQKYGVKLPRHNLSKEVMGGMVKIQTNLGSSHGLEVKNILGAIINEVKVSRDVVGKIQIRETFSLVEVSKKFVDIIIKKLHNKKFAGKAFNFKLYK